MDLEGTGTQISDGHQRSHSSHESSQGGVSKLGHSLERKSRPQISVGTGSISIPSRLPRGRAACFLPENPRLHVLPVRVVLGCKLPPSLVSVSEAARLRRQRHS
jgi:hypothetical protein